MSGAGVGLCQLAVGSVDSCQALAEAAALVPKDYQGEQSIAVTIRSSGDIHMRIGGESRFPGRSTVLQEALVNNIAFNEGVLTADSLAQLETSDTARRAHVTSLNLKLRGDVLNGYVIAQSVFDGFWHYGLPYWTELRRVGDAPATR